MHNRMPNGMEKVVITEPLDVQTNPFSKYAQQHSNHSHRYTPSSHGDHETTNVNTRSTHSNHGNNHGVSKSRRASSSSLTDLEVTNAKMIESASGSSKPVSSSKSGAFQAEVSPTGEASTSDLEAFLEELSRKEAEIANPSVDIICMVDALKNSHSSDQVILKELDEIARIAQEGLVLLQRGKKHVENARLRLKSTFVKGSFSSDHHRLC